MAKFKHLTTEERRAIINMHKENKTCRDIAKIFGKSFQAISKIINTFKREGRISEGEHTGRPRVTTKRVDTRIVALSSSNAFMSAVEIQSKLVSEGKRAPSIETVRRRLHENGRYGRVARKIPFVSKKNKKERMAFYYEHVLKPESFWFRILWTDESYIRLGHSHGQMYVWRKRRQSFSYECTKHTLKTQDRGIMVWGCFSAYGVGKVVCLRGKINSQIYLKLLQEVIIPEGKHLIGPDFILQQDNAPIHKAKIVSDYLRNEKINILQWPPQSPDLSPIENMWSWLKHKVSQRTPKNLDELQKCIEEIWPTFTVEDCRKYALSVQRRLVVMSDKNGDHCEY